jgi:hypothetical protein
MGYPVRNIQVLTLNQERCHFLRQFVPEMNYLLWKTASLKEPCWFSIFFCSKLME